MVIWWCDLKFEFHGEHDIFLIKQSPNFFFERIEKLSKRWEKCIVKHDYIENKILFKIL